jgi:hypothetical protein
VSPKLPTDPPVRHRIAAVLALVDLLRMIALDESLTADQALSQIRAAFAAHEDTP